MTRNHSLVVKVSHSESGGSVSILARHWTLCHLSAILRGTEPVSALTRALLNCCALHIFSPSWISSVAISRWQGFDSKHEHPTVFRLPLFWSTWRRARGPDLAACAGLAHWRDYSDCRATEKCHKSAWPMNCKKYLKKGGNCEGFSTLIPQTALALRAAAYRGNKISTSCVRPVARWRRNMPRSLAALSKSQHLVPRMQGHLVCWPRAKRVEKKRVQPRQW